MNWLKQGGGGECAAALLGQRSYHQAWKGRVLVTRVACLKSAKGGREGFV